MLNDIILTKSEYIYVIRYGEVDNSDLAIDFFKRVKKNWR